MVDRLRSLAPDALLGVTPFFLGWGLHRPHLPFLHPERFLDLYPQDSISVPNNKVINQDTGN